jgi:formylmethanofuran dehydrogenase subunit E
MEDTMTDSGILSSEDFKRCADFHGHVCPGLAIGYRAAKAGMSWLTENRAVDEELVAIVETDSCSADAIQVLTGCTFGKGNFIYQDYGKQALTLVSRKTGAGVRVALKPGALELTQRHRDLLETISHDQASQDERNEFSELHQQRTGELLERPVDSLFEVRAAHVTLPAKARIEPSETCDSCGEPTMAAKLSTKGGRRLCRACIN